MADREQYAPGPPSGAQVRKDGEKWTLILVRELRHSPEKVWQALTDPAHLREWAPFEADGSLGTVGTRVKLTWVGAPAPQETTVTRADAPKALEYSWGGFDMRWQLEALGGGTRLTLWTNIDRRFMSMGAAGWHICFGVMDHLLSGTPIGRIVGPEAMKFGGWQRLNADYAKQFGIETPNWPPPTPGSIEGGSADRRFCGPRLFGVVRRGSDSRPGIGGHSHAVNDEAAVPLLLCGTHARILVVARPSPILGASDQARPDRIQMNVIDLLVVLGDCAQGAIEKAWLPELALRAPARIDAAHRTLLNRLDGQRNRQGITGRADAMPMIGEKDPGREIERVERPCPMEGTRQEDEIRLGEFSAP